MFNLHPCVRTARQETGPRLQASQLCHFSHSPLARSSFTVLLSLSRFWTEAFLHECLDVRCLLYGLSSSRVFASPCRASAFWRLPTALLSPPSNFWRPVAQTAHPSSSGHQTTVLVGCRHDVSGQRQKHKEQGYSVCGMALHSSAPLRAFLTRLKFRSCLVVTFRVRLPW